jgi:hypothetical protein
VSKVLNVETIEIRLEELVKELPDALEASSLHELLDGVVKGVPIAEAMKACEGGTLIPLPFGNMQNAIETIEDWDLGSAPWAHLSQNPNIGLALEYGFVLGLRFAYEEQKQKEKTA